MTLGTHTSLLCLFNLIVFPWNQPAHGWGVPRSTERSYDLNSDYTAYNARNYHVIPSHGRSNYPDLGYRGREPHSWRDPYGYSGHTPPPRDNPHQRDHGKIHFIYSDHPGRDEENPETLSRRISDDGYGERNPQLLGDVEERKSGMSRINQSSHVKNVKSLSKLSKKSLKRRKRSGDNGGIRETTVATDAAETNFEKARETAAETTEALQETARALAQPFQGGSYEPNKRPNTGHTGKGHSSHRGTSKPRVPTTHSVHRKRNNTHDGDLIFPDNPMFSTKNARCPENESFCEDKQGYPKEYIDRILAEEGDKFKAVFGQDTITDTSLTERRYSDENYLCLSTQRVIFPTKAKNKEEKWQFVINQDGYKQGIGVETCLNAEESCRMGSFPLGYRSFCKQKYITRRLLSLNESGGPGMSEFLFPSCCVCVLTTDGPGVVKS